MTFTQKLYGRLLTLLSITHQNLVKKSCLNFFFRRNGFFFVRANEIQSTVTPKIVVTFTKNFEECLTLMLCTIPKKFGQKWWVNFFLSNGNIKKRVFTLFNGYIPTKNKNCTHLFCVKFYGGHLSVKFIINGHSLDKKSKGGPNGLTTAPT